MKKLIILSTVAVSMGQISVGVAQNANRPTRASELGGNQVAAVAAQHGFSVAEFRRIAAQERSLWADPSGQLLYACEGMVVQGAPTAAGTTVTQTTYPEADTFKLASKPGAARTIYLDFDGNVTSGTSWNSSYTAGASITTPPFDTDGNPSAFSSSELAVMQGIWKRIAEDYMPFDVNVTTTDPGLEALRRTTTSDNIYGVRVCIGGSSYDWLGAGAGGVAYVGSFNWNSDTPCFVFPAQLGNGGEKYVAEAASHEIGHTLGLRHDGTTNGVEYYEGHGNWAPIMGVGYYRTVTQWSKGEYTAANNTQDDLAVMPTYGAPLAIDEHGDILSSASAMTGTQVSGSGVIGSRADIDLFSFITGDGTVSFAAKSANPSTDLDIGLSIYDGLGNLVISSNQPSSLGGALSATLPAGTYYLSVEGVGAGDPTTSYNDYGSEGEYTLTGTVLPAPNQPPVASTAGTTPLSGVAPLTVNFNGSSSYDLDGTIATYDWTFADGTAGSGATVSKTYTQPGIYDASLVVVDNGGLSSAAAVTIVVSNAPALPGVKISSLTLSSSYNSKSRSTTVTVTATVKNETGTLISGATVTGSWTGLYVANASATTSSRGQATFKSPALKGPGTVTFTVTGITASGYQYKSALNSATSVSTSIP